MSVAGWQIEFTRPLCFAALAALPLLLIFWQWSLAHASPARKIGSLPICGTTTGFPDSTTRPVTPSPTE